MADQKFLPVNVQLVILKPEESRSEPTLMCAVPHSDALKAAQGFMNTLPCRLEIMLNDPEDGVDKWYAVPFRFPPPPSIIEVNPKGRRN